MIKYVFKFLTKTKLWDWFLSHPMAHLKLRLIDYPFFPMSKYHEIREFLNKDPESFYVFVGTDTRSFSYKVNNLASGAKWAHAGIILAGEKPRLLHSIVTGVCTWDLLDYLREVDNFAIIKINLNEEDAVTAQQRIEDIQEHFLGLPYDNGFNLGDRKSMYCSELVYSVFEDLVDEPCFDPKYIAEMPFFTPDDVYSCGQLSWSIITK
jgi:uncharacterized protein YycO